MAQAALGELAEAEATLQRAIALNKRLTPDTETANMAANYGNLAAVHERQHKLDDAESGYRRSLEIYRLLFGDDRSETINAQTNLGLLLMSRGKTEEARESAKAYLAGFQKRLVNLLSWGTEEQQLSLKQSYEPFAFFATMGDAQSLAEAVIRYKGVVTDTTLEQASHTRTPRSQEEMDIVHRWEDARRQLTQLTLEDSTQQAAGAELRERRRKQAELLAAEAAELHARLPKTGSTTEQAASWFSLDPADVQKRLPSNTVLVDFIRYNHYLGALKWETRYGAVILARAAAAKWVPLGSAWKLEQYTDIYERAIRGQYTMAPLENVLRTVFDRAMGPVLKACKGLGNRLLISPDGELNFVSFAALLMPDGRFVADDYSVTYVANARHLLRESTQPSSLKGVFIFANPPFRTKPTPANFIGESKKGLWSKEGLFKHDRFPELQSLPHTLDEASSLKRLAQQRGWTVTVRTGSDAREEDVRMITRPAILHLATHGFYLNRYGSELVQEEPPDRGVGGVRARKPDVRSYSKEYMSHEHVALENPMHRSGVALAGAQNTLENWRNGIVPKVGTDGVLNGEEAAMLNLEGTWLVTLSSCDSGRGQAQPGEGMFGLRRGFLQAGAHNVLTTLWSINDAVTASMMKSFYEKALTTGDAPASLAEVQRDFLNRLRKNHGVEQAVLSAGAFVLTTQGLPSNRFRP